MDGMHLFLALVSPVVSRELAALFAPPPPVVRGLRIAIGVRVLFALSEMRVNPRSSSSSVWHSKLTTLGLQLHPPALLRPGPACPGGWKSVMICGC